MERYTADVAIEFTKLLFVRGIVFVLLRIRLQYSAAMFNTNVLSQSVDVPEHFAAGSALERTVTTMNTRVGSQCFFSGKTYAAELADVRFCRISDWPTWCLLLTGDRRDPIVPSRARRIISTVQKDKIERSHAVQNGREFSQE